MHIFKNKAQNLSLRTKLFLSITMITIIPFLVISLFLYTKVYDMILSDTIRKDQLQSASTAPMIGNIIDEITDSHQQIRSLSSLSSILTGNYVSASPLVSETALTSFNHEITQIISDSYLSGVRIYMDLPADVLHSVTARSNDVIQPVSQINGAYWKGIFAGDPRKNELHCPAFYLTHTELDQLGNSAYITRHSFYLNGSSVTVYIAVYYNNQILQQLLAQSLPFKDSVSYIINERDSIICTTNSALSGMYYIGYNDISEYFMSSNNFLKKTVLGEDIYAAMNNITQNGWYIVTVIPAGSILQQTNRIILQYCLLLLLLLLLTFLLTLKISGSITRRLSMVSKQMARIKYEPPVPLDTPQEHDEIGNLIETYNYMCVEMQKLLDQQKQAAEDLRLSEFNSLQAQINPHFLYNTMDMINWMAAQGQTDRITQAVQDLSRFYRLTLSKSGSLSTIEEEIEHVSIYVRIQNMRFHDNIDFIVDIPDELLECRIPKLTLQPFVENSILHGIMEKESQTGNIVLTGWEDENGIELLLSDDGVGMNQQQLDQILSSEPVEKSKTGTNIGICNTHHRLQLLFGDTYSLTYSSTPGKGTDVSIRIPFSPGD